MRSGPCFAQPGDAPVRGVQEAFGFAQGSRSVGLRSEVAATEGAGLHHAEAGKPALESLAETF